MKTPSIGISWLRLDKNHLKATSSTRLESFSLSFFLLLEHCSNAVNSFALFLTQVETVFLGTPYFAVTSLLH